jgi:tetratricopeptide (TPR) repeat protein
MIPRLLALLVMCLVAIAPRPAFADDPATRSAKRHFERGEKLFALGKFDEALDEYQKAFDAKPIPDFLYNIAQCYRNLGDYDQAIFSFKKFLKLEPDAPNRESVERTIEQLEEKKDRDGGKKFIEKPPPPVITPADNKPIYKKWWFWTGVAVVGVAGGAGIYAGTRGGAPSTDLGNLVFGK